MKLLLWALNRRHRHVWDDVHCWPPACVICGRTARD